MHTYVQKSRHTTTHTYIHVYIYIHICTHVYIYIYVCVCVCAYISDFENDTCMYIHIAEKCWHHRSC